MKKLIILSLAVLLYLPVTVYAASIGGAETQGQGKFAVGLDSEFVSGRDMKYKSGATATNTYENVEIEDMYRIFAKASYGILENLDVYVKLGAVDFERTQDRYNTSGVLQASGKTTTDTEFAYGFGIKGTYELENDWLLGIDLQYLAHKNDGKDKETTVSGTESTEPVEETIKEWQVAPYIGKKMGDFLPYLGVKYSDVKSKVKAKDAGVTLKYEADDNVGVFVGTDYKIGENWILNLEGRFIDETAMSFATTYRF